MKLLNLISIAGLLLLGVAFTACKKSQNIGRTGVIDYYVIYGGINSPGRGHSIKFTNDSILYQISNDLTPFGINTIASTDFPINVTVTSTPDNAEPKNYDYVIITSLKINK